MNTRSSAVAAVAAASLLLAACGDDSEVTDLDEGSSGSASGSASASGSGSGSASASASGSVADSESSSSSESAGGAADCVEGKLFADGRLTVATGEPVFEPWMVDDDPTNGEGYESAVVYEVADRLGFSADQVDWVRTTFDEAITPAEKDYDFNLQQYTITEEREEIVDFSAPYYTADRVVMAMDGTPAAEATTLSELRDVSWAATVGTNDLEYIQDVIGVEDVPVFNNQADTQAAMQAGQADATVVNLPSAYYLTNVEMPEAVIAGLLPEGGEGTEQFGFLFADGNPLRECIDPVLEEMASDGTLDDLSAQWLEGDGSIPTITED